MKALVLSASPNEDGLTAACAQAAAQGLIAGGAEVEQVCLNHLKISSCHACDRGWGTCQAYHRCQVEDDFQVLHEQTCQADAIVLVTPVYWGDMSESTKAFTDRLRRCEATRGQDSCLAGHPVMMVAAAGGSGNGMMTCLASLERWIDHVRARKYDLIPVNRWSREYKLNAIQAAAESLVLQMKEEAVKAN